MKKGFGADSGITKEKVIYRNNTADLDNGDGGRVKFRTSLSPVIEDYLVLVILNDLNGGSRLFLATFNIKKNVETQQIIRVAQRVKFRRNLTTEELKKIVTGYRAPKNIGAADINVSSDTQFSENTTIYDLFNLPDEGALIREYQHIYGKIRFGDSLPQELKNGVAVFLDIDKRPREFAIQYDGIRQETLAVLMAMKAVKDSRTREMLKAITGDSYATLRG